MSCSFCATEYYETNKEKYYMLECPECGDLYQVAKEVVCVNGASTILAIVMSSTSHTGNISTLTG